MASLPEHNFSIIKDEISMFTKKKVYALAGDKVTVLSTSGNVAIVEKENGERFSTLLSNLK